MADDEIPGMVDEELAAFAALARDLRTEDWAAPSLCPGWTVRDVVRHTAFHTHRAGLRQMLGSADKWTARLATEAGADTDEGLVAWLGSPAPDDIRKSVVNVCELVIHQQDVRRPLGVPRAYPGATLRTVLDYCVTLAGAVYVVGGRRRNGRGLHLVATDLEWSVGDGPEVRGTGEALLLAVAGRPVVLPELTGAGVDVLAGRIDAAGVRSPAA